MVGYQDEYGGLLLDEYGGYVIRMNMVIRMYGGLLG